MALLTKGDVMRFLIIAALAASCSGSREPARPRVGTPQRDARVTRAETPWGDRMFSDGAGLVTFFGEQRSAAVRVDWQAKTAEVPLGVSLYGPGPLLLRGATTTLEWPGGGGAPRPAGWSSGGAWLAARAAVPLVTSPQGERIAFEGWRADGTRAWRVEPPLPGTHARLVAHLGDLVLIQAVDKHDEARGWSDGVTLMLDATTGQERWRMVHPTSRDYPSASRAAPHGDEIALMYENPARIEVISRVDGAVRRRVRLDTTGMTIADHVGFDGDVMWSYRYTAPRERPSNHMWGTGPRPDAPASCEYEVWDTRHDRGHAVRTMADLPRDWQIDCEARALLPLDNGGVQVVLGSRFEPDSIRAIWFDRAP